MNRASDGVTLIDRLVARPTVGFTALLMFCGAWWLLSLIFSGLDADVDDAQTSHGHASQGHEGQGRGGHSNGSLGRGPAASGVPSSGGAHDHLGSHGHIGRIVRRSSRGSSRTGRGGIRRALRLGDLPLSLGLTLFAFGGWAVSLLGQTLLGRPPVGHLSPAIAIALGGAGIVAGLAFVSRCARWLEPVFETATAPQRSAVVGSLCRIRTLNSSTRTGLMHGLADVVSGPVIGASISIHANPSDPSADGLTKGSLAIVALYDDAKASFVVVEAPPGVVDPAHP